MATMNSVIEYIDGVKPNVYTDDDKYKWIATVDGLISLEVHQDAEATTYKLQDDADKELLVKAPYDDIYGLYVAAMIDFHNKEYNNYNNSVLMFTDRLEAYKANYIQRNRKKTAKNFRNVMG